MTNLFKSKLPLRGFLSIASHHPARVVAREAVTPHYSYPLTIALAVAATATSLSVAAYSGWERGDTYVERATYTALSVVIASGVHFLPALSQQRPLAARIALSLVCMAGLVVTLYGQAEFFTLAQQHAGARRADTVPAVTSYASAEISSSRSLTAIAADQASARKALAVVDNAQSCHGHCKDLRARRAVLIATLDELDTEANEAKRRESAEDRQAEQIERATRMRDTLRDDPVTVRLAEWLGVDEDRVDLLFALICACVLDGIGAMGWYFVLSTRLSDDAAGGAGVLSTGKHGCNSIIQGEHAKDLETSFLSAANVDARLPQLMRDVAEGKVPATVAGIRNHLGCAQETAAKLRRELLAFRAVIVRSNGGRHAGN